ncbi:hypothetical protein B566_EDAN001075 [Ephemera danica]|nr:hypothetical protein B566_EDAN001075 [Ephemera danica]
MYIRCDVNNIIIYSKRMWSSVTPQPPDAAAPSSRAKHSATLLGGHLYLLGGRNGNIPLKDFWRYSLGW